MRGDLWMARKLGQERLVMARMTVVAAIVLVLVCMAFGAR